MTDGNKRGRLTRIGARFTRPSHVWLALRCLAWACVLPLLKRTLPITTLVGWMQQPSRLARRDASLEERIVLFARWACRATRLGGDANCLERGLLSYRYLTAANAEPTLFIGVRRITGGVDGHAWVTTDGVPRGESPSILATYTVIVTFDWTGQLSANADTASAQARATP